MSGEVSENKAVPVIGYVVIFSGIYAALTVFFQILAYVFDIDPGTGANTGTFVGAGLGAMMKFVNDQKRPPIKSEKRKLIWLSILSSFFISIIVGLIMLLILEGGDALNELSVLILELPKAVLFLSVLIFTALSYIMLRINYGWGARFYYKRLTKNQM